MPPSCTTPVRSSLTEFASKTRTTVSETGNLASAGSVPCSTEQVASTHASELHGRAAEAAALLQRTGEGRATMVMTNAKSASVSAESASVSAKERCRPRRDGRQSSRRQRHVPTHMPAHDMHMHMHVHMRMLSSAG